MTTAIIPARGGSKGVRRKNLCNVGGRSLLEIAIEKCQLAGMDRVIVSTESAEILQVALRAGADIAPRPLELASDETESVDVLRQVAAGFGVKGEILFMQCTAPLVHPADLSRCVSERGEADMSVLCHPFHGIVVDSDGSIINRPRHITRRQDCEPQFVLSGSAWSFDVSYLQNEFYSGVIKPVPVGGFWCDIDTYDDLRFANWAASSEECYPVRV